MYICVRIIQQVFLIYIQYKQDIVLLGEDYNLLDNFGPHLKKESILKERNIEENHKDSVNKCIDIKNYAKNSLLKSTLQAEFFANKLLSSLKDVRFSKPKCPIGKTISEIKYYHFDSQNNILSIYSIINQTI